jgi:uncharacterized protein (DUF58 family)
MARLTLTRQGVAVVVAAAICLVVGRTFGIIELYVISAACVAAVAAGVVYVWIRRPSVEATRWIHPSLLVVGDVGRVDIQLHHSGRIASAPFVLEEPVVRASADDQVARLPVPALPGGASSSSGYRVPTAARGTISVGPLRAILGDALGLARSRREIADVDEIVVAPRTVALDMPELGRGVLGRALLETARRLGPGDFHGLREYAVGDEPRSIHWRASARADELMVKEHTVEGLHQCTVVFDATLSGHGTRANFELGVTAAASLVHSAEQAGLRARFVAADGVDLRGPDVAANTLRVLARIEPTESTLAPLDADVLDGLAVLVVVTGSRLTPAWRAANSVADPTITKVSVTTADAASHRLGVNASSEQSFVEGWQWLVGRP